MTSGVVYSIMMHSVIITAYALLIFRIFYINGFDLDQLNDVSVPIMFTYLPYGVLEVAVRRFNNDDPLIHTKVGHLSHFVACIMLPDYMVPSTPIEGLVFFFLGGSLLYWTFFVLIAFGILALLEDVRGSLTQPLV